MNLLENANGEPDKLFASAELALSFAVSLGNSDYPAAPKHSGRWPNRSTSAFPKPILSDPTR